MLLYIRKEGGEDSHTDSKLPILAYAKNHLTRGKSRARVVAEYRALGFRPSIWPPTYELEKILEYVLSYFYKSMFVKKYI